MLEYPDAAPRGPNACPSAVWPSCGLGRSRPKGDAMRIYRCRTIVASLDACQRWAALAGLVVLLACGGSSTSKCVEGASIACTCSSGGSGAQVCNSKGVYGPCSCAPTDPSEASKRSVPAGNSSEPVKTHDIWQETNQGDKDAPAAKVAREDTIVGRWAGEVTGATWEGDYNEPGPPTTSERRFEMGADPSRRRKPDRFREVGFGGAVRIDRERVAFAA